MINLVMVVVLGKRFSVPGGNFNFSGLYEFSDRGFSPNGRGGFSGGRGSFHGGGRFARGYHGGHGQSGNQGKVVC